MKNIWMICAVLSFAATMANAASGPTCESVFQAESEDSTDAPNGNYGDYGWLNDGHGGADMGAPMSASLVHILAVDYEKKTAVVEYPRSNGGASQPKTVKLKKLFPDDASPDSRIIGYMKLRGSNQASKVFIVSAVKGKSVVVANVATDRRVRYAWRVKTEDVIFSGRREAYSQHANPDPEVEMDHRMRASIPAEEPGIIESFLLRHLKPR